MKVEVEKQEKFLAKIKLEIPAEQANQEYNKAWRRLGQRINIPGFRRGKAPRGIVEKTVGIERIKQEAMDRLLPHVFADAISEHQLDIVAPPQIETFKFELADGIHIQASVELRPEAKVCDLGNISVNVPEYKIPADAEEKELQAIIARMSTLEPVINRPAEKSDIVNIDFTGYVNNEMIRGGTAKNYRLDLTDNNFIEGFADQIVGHTIGEEFTLNVTFPSNYHDQMLSGKPAEFRVKINEINAKKVPELNDELAKKVGPYDSLQQMKDEIHKMMQESANQENEYRKQKALIEAVIERSDVEVPDAMINREAKMLMEEVQGRLKSQGMSWEKFLDSQGHEQTWDSLREEATKRIKTSLVFGALAKQENLSVNEGEFMEEVRQLAAARGVDEKNIMRHLGNNFEAAQALSDQVLSQKIVDLLMAKATFTMVEDTGETDAKDSTKANKEKAEKAKPEAAVAEAIEGETFDVIEES